MEDVRIEDLSRYTDYIPTLAHLHFAKWGELTGTSTEADYKALLVRCTSSRQIPATLVAVCQNRSLGSVNLVDCDMQIRPELHPWLAQLFVHPAERGRGIGSSLVQAAVARSKELGFHALYLYTSGTLLSFYERLGWVVREIVPYKGKERTVMETKFNG